MNKLGLVYADLHERQVPGRPNAVDYPFRYLLCMTFSWKPNAIAGLGLLIKIMAVSCEEIFLSTLISRTNATQVADTKL
jgi:hypothetical protein